MSERRWSVVSLAIALAVAAPRPAAAEPVTLEDAIARALAAHPSLAGARARLRQAEARSAAGLGTSAELTDAQDALTQALGDAADADYQLAAARTILRYRLGRLVTHPGHRESNP